LLGPVHMPVPPLDSDATLSSSGYEDGLGRRVLAFDRETGGMLERLILRPELCAFEQALIERIALIVGLDDERFVKPRGIERDIHGRVIVTSEHVPGRRLSDIIEAGAEHGIVAGIDAGLGLLLELLPALARLHDEGLVHGAVAPGRIMITPAAQLVLLDSIYGEPLERLQLTRKRLWSEFRLAFPPTAGSARFDKAADIGHAAMVAATLTVGRTLQDTDYPEGVGILRQEILEIASIRGSQAFAEAVDKFFAATLPLVGRRSTMSADEAAIDLRKLVRKELGINTCRTALVEFLQQVETADAERIAAEEAMRQEQRAADAGRRTREDADRQARENAEIEARDEAERLAREAADRSAREAAERQAREEAEREAREEAERKAREEAERRARDEAERKAREEAERKAREEAERRERERLEAERKAREEAERKAREEAERKARAEAERKAREEAERKAREEAERKARAEAERKAREEAERKAREEAERKAREEAERKAREEAERRERERVEAEQRAREEAERRQREREEADRAAQQAAAAFAPPAAAEPAPSSWLVPPGRSSAFDTTPADAPPPQAAAPVAPKPYPIYVPPAEPAAWTADLPPADTSAAQIIAPIGASRSQHPTVSQTGIRLKADDAPSTSPARAESRRDPMEDDVSAAEAYGHRTAPKAAREIPWKLIAAGVVLIAGAFAVSRGYTAKVAPVVGTISKVLPKPTPKAGSAPVGPNVGRLVITTQPPGAKVTVDGKAAGETPLTIEDVKPGRHTIALASDEGSARRTVRVEAGKELGVDVPLFSGFVAISIPFVVDVAEKGKALGTSENPILLSPGRHELRLGNADLGYRVTQTVEVQSGETTRLELDPKAIVNINAAPWAEVFVDGTRVGETPLASVAIRLGVREIVFRNPQFPDKKQTITVTASAPPSISVDFMK
jgi:hypothetical protein